MLFKRIIPIVTIVFAFIFALGCGGPGIQSEDEPAAMEESISQDDQNILEEVVEMKRDRARMYIESTNETLDEFKYMIDEKREEAAQLDENARLVMEQDLDYLQQERDRIATLLEEMQQDLEELESAIEYEDTDAARELEDAYYEAFLKKKQDLDEAVKALENAYYEAFLEENNTMDAE